MLQSVEPSHNIIISPINEFAPLIDIVINDLNSEHSKRAYKQGLNDFLGWWMNRGKPQFCKAEVLAYKESLRRRNLSSSSINLRLCAVRRLASEAVDNGLIDTGLAAGIARVKDIHSRGVRSGNWLTKNEAEKLLRSPDISTIDGLRDRAMLAVMIGSGLRRAEIANLRVDHIQQRDGRWCFVDLIGKGNKIRTVPIPTWCKTALDAWMKAAFITSGPVFRAFKRYYVGLFPGKLTTQTVYNIVKHYSDLCGFGVKAHDLRRTYAKLCHSGGAPLEQIQLSLGHSSIITTERYLGLQQNLTVAPCDFLGINL
jgi:integrase/recombinase XerD